MTKLLSQVNYLTSFYIPGESGQYRLVMGDSKIIRGYKKLYVAPFLEGRLFADRGRWLDFDLLVDITRESVDSI